MIIYRNIFDATTGVTTKTQLHDIEIDQQTELRQSISGEDLISSRFTLGQKIDLKIGDFVEFKDSVYTILDEPQVKKSQNTFAYHIEFKSDQYILKNVMAFNPDLNFTESEFHYFGDAIDMVSLIIANLNRVYTDGSYYADYVEQVEPRNISFKNENCLSAIQRLATEFGCEFSVKGKKITFRRKIGKETDLVFEYKKELRKIERQTLQNAELLTVLYPFGSERNITNDYGSRRLTIPKLENNKDLFGTIERSVFFEDIYPRLNGQVSAVHSNNIFSDTGIDFDINNQLIGGVKAKVIFNTGDLAGRQYEIATYNHVNRKVELVPYTDDTDFTTPNDTFKPRVGDKYVLIGIQMPQAYIDNAEAELLQRATEYLEKYSQPNVIYKVAPHYPALRKNQRDLNLGDIITLKDADFGIEFKTRILKLNQKVANRFEYQLDIGNQATVTYFTKVMNDQKNLRNNIYLNEKYTQERFNRITHAVKGLNQVFYVNRGEFDPANFYYNNEHRRDFVYRVKLDGTKEWYYYIGIDHARSEWIQANWQLIGANFEIVATQTVLAENANIGNWIIQNGQIVSQDSSWENYPNAQMNGKEGYLRFITGVHAWSLTGYHKYMQVLEIGGFGEGFTIHRAGDVHQEQANVDFSSKGLRANFAGQSDRETGKPEGPEGVGAVVGIGRSKSTLHDFIAGVIGWAQNTAENAVKPFFGGVFWKLKSFGRYKNVQMLTGTTFQCDAHTEFLSCYNTSGLRIYLPKNPDQGQYLEVKRISADVSVYATDKKICRSTIVDGVSVPKSDIWRFIYDGKYWQANVIQ